MRKRSLRILTVFICIAALCAVLSACTTEEAEVTLKELTVISGSGEYILGETVDLSKIVLKAVYSDGSEKEIKADDSMLGEEDRNKFFSEGVHTVYISYGGMTAAFQIEVISVREETLYKAQFFSNGGSEVETVYAVVIDSFRIPYRDGYDFVGWYTDPDFSGDNAIAPYALSSDVNFYAKWEDKRRCTVTFLVDGEVYNSVEVVYGTGIDVTDLDAYPAPEKEGKTFTGWALASGSDLSEINTDTTVSASYESVKCSVQIEYWDEAEGKLVEKPLTLNYGDYFNLDGYVMPTQDGYTSRWVVYKNGSTDFEEIDGYLLTVTTNIKIAAYHVINTYSVTIYNGGTQTEANLKSGNIELSRVYADSATLTDYSVDYGSGFILSDFVQTPYLATPASINGYDAVWCYVITTSSGEIWRNASNYVWNEGSGKFELQDGDEETSNFKLYDKDGNYIAEVRSGDLYNIQGDVTIKAKYTKKDYTVRLLRKGTSGYNVEIATFSVKYLDDFRLYDPTIYDASLGLSTPQEVEYYYILNKVAAWSADIAAWQDIYYAMGDEDWEVAWYRSSNLTDDALIDFSERNGVLGSYEITGDLTLYCSDVDKRYYEVALFYNYDFEKTDNYGYNKMASGYYSENETVEVPADLNTSVQRAYVYNGETYYVTYTFSGWYDYPYEPDGNVTGTYYASLNKRTRNMTYYAHYVCNTTYTVTVYDKIQSTAYSGTVYDGLNYSVGENGIIYTVSAGTVFDLSLIHI